MTDPDVARRTHRTLEPFHGMIYFAPEAAEEYEALGIAGRDGYFASRAAPMGRVPAEVVIATFYNFNPDAGPPRDPRRVGPGGPGRDRGGTLARRRPGVAIDARTGGGRG